MGSVVVAHRLSCSAACGMWDLPGPGLEPMSPALAGGLLTIVQPGKSLSYYFFFFKHLYWSIIALQWCVSFCSITK